MQEELARLFQGNPDPHSVHMFMRDHMFTEATNGAAHVAAHGIISEGDVYRGLFFYFFSWAMHYGQEAGALTEADAADLNALEAAIPGMISVALELHEKKLTGDPHAP